MMRLSPIITAQRVKGSEDSAEASAVGAKATESDAVSVLLCAEATVPDAEAVWVGRTTIKDSAEGCGDAAEASEECAEASKGGAAATGECAAKFYACVLPASMGEMMAGCGAEERGYHAKGAGCCWSPDQNMYLAVYCWSGNHSFQEDLLRCKMLFMRIRIALFLCVRVAPPEQREMLF